MVANIVLKQGSLSKANTSFIVVPQNTKGEVSKFFTELPQWSKDHYVQESSELGDQSYFLTSGKSDKMKGVVLATSATVTEPGKKKGDHSSELDKINKLGRELAKFNKNLVIDRIASPLLGAGWGGLKPREAYIKLAKGFESIQTSSKLDIYVLNRQIYQELKEVDLSEYDENGNFITRQDRMEVKIETVSDTPITDEDEDKLDFKTFANALAGIIDSPETKTPLTMVINAPWGAGKSSLGNLTRRKLEKMPADSPRKHRTIWFNAWKHDESDYLKTAFTAFIAREINPYRSWWHRLWDPMSLDLMAPSDRFSRRLRSIFFYLLVTLLLVILFRLAYSISSLKPLIDSIGQLLPKGVRNYSEIAIGGTSLLSISLFKYLVQFTSTLKSFIKDPKPEASAGKFKLVEQQLHKLIDQAVPKDRRLIIFIDDLERCRKTGPVDLLETINQLLDHPKVVTVILADIYTVAASADLKYEEFSKRYNPSNSHFGKQSKEETGAYGRLYIQKIIQLQFDLPIFKPDEIKVLVSANQSSSVTGLDTDESTLNQEEANKSSSFWDRFFEVVTSTMDRQTISVRELGRDQDLHPFFIFLLIIIRLLMYPVSITSWMLRNLYGQRWNVNVDEKRSGSFKWGNFVLTILFIITSIVAYYGLIVNGTQRLTFGQYKPLYVEEFLREGADTVSTQPTKLQDQMINYLTAYLNVRALQDEWQDPRDLDRISHWRSETQKVFEIKLDTPLNFPIYATTFLSVIRDATDDSELIKGKLPREVIDLTIPNDTTYQQVFDRMETATHTFINTYVYERTKSSLEVPFATASIILLLMIGVAQGIMMFAAYGRNRELLKKYTEAVDEKTSDGSLTGEVFDSNLSREAREGIKRKVVYSKIEQRSVKYQKSLDHTLKILDLVLPRNAKRVSNKLRLMFNIAYERKILGNLEAEHFAKWVALQEAYPEIVAFISRNTGHMKDLEEACEQTKEDRDKSNENELNQQTNENTEDKPTEAPFESFMNKIDSKLAEDYRIIDFVLYGEGQFLLSEKIQHLVYFT